MIENEKDLVNSSNRFAMRTCDECLKKEKARMSVIVRGRKRRKSNTDLCTLCSSLIKYKSTIFSQKMEKAVNWTGGKQIDRGYSKIYIGNGKRIFEHVKIFEEHLGRSLAKEECIHHIDGDKLNNDLNNLYLCRNKKYHGYCHSSMEHCGFRLLGTNIWFDWNNLIYSIKYFLPQIIDTNVKDIFQKRSYIKTRWSKPYNYIRDLNKYRGVHCLIAERSIGRHLYSNEVVHHIDGHTLNNAPSNLIVMTRQKHTLCHISLQTCVCELVKLNLVKFNAGRYQQDIGEIDESYKTFNVN